MQIEIKPEDYEIIIPKTSLFRIFLKKITLIAEKYGGWEFLIGSCIFFYLFVNFILPFSPVHFPYVSEEYKNTTLWGSNFYLLINYLMDIYRFVTANFLHFGFLHLFFNCLGIYVLGGLLQKIWNARSVFIVFILTGIGAHIGSFFITKGNSAGASGGVFGLMGALLGFFFFDRSIHPLIRKNMLSQIGFMFILNFLLGILIPNIDLVGHLFGFILGIIAASLWHWLQIIQKDYLLTIKWIFLLFLLLSSFILATIKYFSLFFI